MLVCCMKLRRSMTYNPIPATPLRQWAVRATVFATHERTFPSAVSVFRSATTTQAIRVATKASMTPSASRPTKNATSSPEPSVQETSYAGDRLRTKYSCMHVHVHVDTYAFTCTCPCGRYECMICKCYCWCFSLCSCVNGHSYVGSKCFDNVYIGLVVIGSLGFIILVLIVAVVAALTRRPRVEHVAMCVTLTRWRLGWSWSYCVSFRINDEDDSEAELHNSNLQESFNDNFVLRKKYDVHVHVYCSAYIMWDGCMCDLNRDTTISSGEDSLNDQPVHSSSQIDVSLGSFT